MKQDCSYQGEALIVPNALKKQKKIKKKFRVFFSENPSRGLFYYRAHFRRLTFSAIGFDLIEEW